MSNLTATLYFPQPDSPCWLLRSNGQFVGVWVERYAGPLPAEYEVVND